uniref:Protein kinase domain-containing protein n=1 Tax=Panagrellus redivivus TaxID=6233 RepID=A0A7E4WAS7_PANRE
MSLIDFGHTGRLARCHMSQNMTASSVPPSRCHFQRKPHTSLSNVESPRIPSMTRRINQCQLKRSFFCYSLLASHCYCCLLLRYVTLNCYGNAIVSLLTAKPSTVSLRIGTYQCSFSNSPIQSQM